MQPLLHRSARPAFVALAAPIVLTAFVVLGACKDTTGVANVGDGDVTAALSVDPAVVPLGSAARFDAGASVDTNDVEARFSDTTIDGFTFDFGDGTVVQSDVFFADHIYAAPGDYTASVTVTEGDDSDTADVAVTVSWPAPTLLGVDVSGDERAVIGEWVTLEGRGFREANLPSVNFGVVPAVNVRFVSEFQIEVQVPVRTPSGWVDVAIDFPDDDDGDGEYEVWVTRYGLATDAWRGRVYLAEFGHGAQYWLSSQSLEIDDAAVARISGDGAYALLGDARYQATLAPSVKVVDLTADFQPVVTADLDDLGVGPLFDIAIARDVNIAVVTDAAGFTVVNLDDPATPYVIGDREAYQFSEIAPTAIALNPDGTRLAVLSTFNDRVRFYDLTPTGPIYDTDSVDVGPGTQDMGVWGDGDLLYVLGGGGEGAIPPDLSLGNSTITVVDFSGGVVENVHGDGVFLGLGNEVSVPIEMAIAPSGRAYVTTLDNNLGLLLDAFGDIVSNPGNVGAWQGVIESLGDLGFGSVRPVDGVLEGSVLVGEGWFSPYGFQAGLDVRYDERFYVSTAIGLGWTLEILNGESLVHLSLDIDYGVIVGDLQTGEVDVFPMFTEPVVSYIDFQLNYDLGPLVSLLLPPYAFGDVAIQP